MLSDDRLNSKLAGICFDRQRYQQILLNLVQNGVKFTATGGVELIIEVELGSQSMQNSSQIGRDKSGNKPSLFPGMENLLEQQTPTTNANTAV